MKYSWKHGIFEIEKFMLPTKTLLLSILLFLIFSDSVSVVVLRVAFVFHSSPFSPRAPTSSICEVVRPSGLISNLYIFSGKKKILASGIQVSNSLCLGSTKAKILFLTFLSNRGCSDTNSCILRCRLPVDRHARFPQQQTDIQAETSQ